MATLLACACLIFATRAYSSPPLASVSVISPVERKAHTGCNFVQFFKGHTQLCVTQTLQSEL